MTIIIITIIVANSNSNSNRNSNNNNTVIIVLAIVIVTVRVRVVGISKPWQIRLALGVAVHGQTLRSFSCTGRNEDNRHLLLGRAQLTLNPFFAPGLAQP